MQGLEHITVLGVFFQSVGCEQIWKRDVRFDDKVFLSEPNVKSKPLYVLSVMSCGRLCKKNGRSPAFSHIEDKCYCYSNRTDGQSFTFLEGAQYYFLSDDYFFLSDEKNCKDHNYQYLSEIRVCYKDYNDSKIWQDANKKCRSDGGHLIMLDTVGKLSVFQNIIPKNVYYWVGLEDMDQDGTWIWTKNTSKDFDRKLWFPGEPNGNEFCGMVQYLPSDPRAGIFDLICDSPSRFICEM